MITGRSIINLYNPSRYSTPKQDLIDFKFIIKEDIIHSKIKYLIFEKEYVKVELDSKNLIITSLKDEDYTGPESVSIHFNTGEIIVIN